MYALYVCFTHTQVKEDEKKDYGIGDDDLKELKEEPGNFDKLQENTPYMYSLCVLLICTPYVHSLYVCLICILTNHRKSSRLQKKPSLCVLLMCMPYMYIDKPQEKLKAAEEATFTDANQGLTVRLPYMYSLYVRRMRVCLICMPRTVRMPYMYHPMQAFKLTQTCTYVTSSCTYVTSSHHHICTTQCKHPITHKHAHTLT